MFSKIKLPQHSHDLEIKTSANCQITVSFRRPPDIDVVADILNLEVQGLQVTNHLNVFKDSVVAKCMEDFVILSSNYKG